MYLTYITINDYFQEYFFKRNNLNPKDVWIESIQEHEWGWEILLGDIFIELSFLPCGIDKKIFVHRNGNIMDEDSICYNNDYCFNSDHPDYDEEGYMIGEMFYGDEYTVEKFKYLSEEYQETQMYFYLNNSKVTPVICHKGDEESGT
jgi:hypothetical protein